MGNIYLKKLSESSFRSEIVFKGGTSLSTPEPTETLEIETYLAKYLRKIGKEEFISVFGLESFGIEVLSIKRTFIEKVFAILDYTFEEDPEQELGNKIRHLYDIHKLYQLKEVQDFLNTGESFAMASKVVVQNDFFGKRKDTILVGRRIGKNCILGIKMT